MKKSECADLSVLRTVFYVLSLMLFAHSAWGVTSCTVDANALNFGMYTSTATLDVATTVTVKCNGSKKNDPLTVPYTLSAAKGPGTFAARRMVNSAGDRLIYNIYTNSSHTIVWGNGKQSTATIDNIVKMIANGNTSSGSLSNSIYGRINSGQDVPPGNYATATPITVTVDF